MYQAVLTKTNFAPINYNNPWELLRVNNTLLWPNCTVLYQTVQSYCLSRDCPISCARCLKCCLQKPSQRRTLQQKSPLRNNISPSNIKYSFKITKSLRYRLLFFQSTLSLSSISKCHNINFKVLALF